MRNNSTLTYLISNYKPADQNNEVNAEMEELLITMDSEDFSPSQRSIDNILNFARSYDVMESENTGVIEMNLN